MGVASGHVQWIAERVAPMVERLSVPAGERAARDVAFMRALPNPTSEAADWAHLLADHGATDMWVQLARGLGEREGYEFGWVATDLLRDARDAGKLVRSHAKELYYRDRPFRQIEGLPEVVYRAPSSSFPSGHALGSASNGAVLTSLDPANALVYDWLAKQVSAARVVGRVHFPTDVVAGSRLGRTVAHELLESHGLPSPRPSSPGRLLQADTYRAFGNDAERADQLLSLMPQDIRSAGAEDATAAQKLHAWFGDRVYDIHLTF